MQLYFVAPYVDGHNNIDIDAGDAEQPTFFLNALMGFGFGQAAVQCSVPHLSASTCWICWKTLRLTVGPSSSIGCFLCSGMITFFSWNMIFSSGF